MALRAGTAIAAAAFIALAPAGVAFATTVDGVEVAPEVGDGDQESGDGGYWGLLGLLGLLAPLFNKKDDVSVSRTTTTGRNDGNPLT